MLKLQFDRYITVQKTDKRDVLDALRESPRPFLAIFQSRNSLKVESFILGGKGLAELGGGNTPCSGLYSEVPGEPRRLKYMKG